VLKVPLNNKQTNKQTSITEWEMYITAQGPRLRNNLYCVDWDVKP